MGKCVRKWGVAMVTAGCVAAGAAGQPSSPLILNEYNAVGGAKMLAEEGSDSHFGRVAGNGGNWVELVVTQDQLDVRGWRLQWTEKGAAGSLVFSDDPLWATLRAGTIVTLIDRPTAAGGLDTDTRMDGADDWWINICTTDARYLKAEGDAGRFSTGNDDFTLTIRDARGAIMFGPVGEGAPVWTGGGVNSQEAGALHANPSPRVTAESPYSDVTTTSFGAANVWIEDEREIVQDLDPLRRGDWGASATTQALPEATVATQAPWLLAKTLGIIDVPGWTCEIVAYCASQKILLSTNGQWKTLDVFRVTSLDPPELEAVDFDDEIDGAQGMWVSGGDPTSVAVHPTQPIALVCALSNVPLQRGWVHGYDLRPDSLGKLVFSQQVGYHPDSIAVSADARYVAVACEGEGSPDTPGSIGLLDISGLTADRRPYHQGVKDFPYHEVAGLARALESPVGDVEPEYVAFDPQSRFVAVSCQENDCVVLVDLRGDKPTLGGVVWLPYGAEPDGIALIDDAVGPDGRNGVVLGVAEEGKFDPIKGRWLGNCASFHWLDPAPGSLGSTPVPLSRVDVNRMIDPSGTIKRRDPESIRFARLGAHIAAVVGVERANRLILLDVTDFTQPRRITLAKVGERPEGLIVVPHGEGFIAITGDEGKADGPGTISFVRLAPNTAASAATSAP